MTVPCGTGVGRFRISEGPRFRILGGGGGGGKGGGGAKSQQAHYVVLTSMRRNDVASTHFDVMCTLDF